MSTTQDVKEPEPSQAKNTFVAAIHAIKTLALPVMDTSCGQMRDPPRGQKQREEQAIPNVCDLQSNSPQCSIRDFCYLETWLVHPPRTPKPPLRIVLVLDILAEHLSYDLVQWFFEHGVMPLDTPVGGSWLSMAESVQRIIVRRALSGQHPKRSSAG